MLSKSIIMNKWIWGFMGINHSYLLNFIDVNDCLAEVDVFLKQMEHKHLVCCIFFLHNTGMYMFNQLKCK